MRNMTLEAMAGACHGQLAGANEMQYLNAEGIVIDSRMVQEGYVFVAIRGERSDGHDFIDKAFADGALGLICERRPEAPKGPYILVESTLQALKDLAAFYLRQMDITVVGITGSVGKTSTKEMIASVLSQKYHVHKTEGNQNNEIGLPLTVFKIREKHQVAVLEMGISDFHEMGRLAAIARPDIGVITNIGLSHLKKLESRDGIFKAKTEMFDYLQEGARVILNGDDDKLCVVDSVRGKKPVFYGVGLKKPETAAYGEKAVYATDIENLGLQGVYLTIHIGEESFRARIPMPGAHNVYNAMTAAAVGRIMGLSNDQIKKGIETMQMIDGRTNLIEVNGMTVIDDCYNANPVSMKASLDVLATALGRTVAVLGDMGELGADKRELHYEVGAYVAEKGIDVLFCAGVLSKEIAAAVREHNPACDVHEYETRDEMLKDLLPFLRQGDAVLVKASHFMEFSEVVEEVITM